MMPLSTANLRPRLHRACKRNYDEAAPSFLALKKRRASIAQPPLRPSPQSSKISKRRNTVPGTIQTPKTHVKEAHRMKQLKQNLPVAHEQNTLANVTDTNPSEVATTSRPQLAVSVESNEEFLKTLKPGMDLMNMRQSLHFKKEVITAMISVLDDSRDFNNTNAPTIDSLSTIALPSEELLLIRELVSLVQAHKFTATASDSNKPESMSVVTNRQNENANKTNSVQVSNVPIASSSMNAATSGIAKQKSPKCDAPTKKPAAFKFAQSKNNDASRRQQYINDTNETIMLALKRGTDKQQQNTSNKQQSVGVSAAPSKENTAPLARSSISNLTSATNNSSSQHTLNIPTSATSALPARPIIRLIEGSAVWPSRTATRLIATSSIPISAYTTLKTAGMNGTPNFRMGNPPILARRNTISNLNMAATTTSQFSPRFMHPTVRAPHPTVRSPYPTVRTPHPTVRAPYPTVRTESANAMVSNNQQHLNIRNANISVRPMGSLQRYSERGITPTSNCRLQVESSKQEST